MCNGSVSNFNGVRFCRRREAGWDKLEVWARVSVSKQGRWRGRESVRNGSFGTSRWRR